MYSKFGKQFRNFTLVILVCAFLTSCTKSGTPSKELQKSSESFSQILEQESLNGLSLTIYYIDPTVLTPFPLSVDNLVDMGHKIIVDTTQLKKQLDLLKALNIEHMIPVKNPSYLDARVVYVFETKCNKIFEIANGGDNSIFVNGVEVENDEIFRNVLVPFVPEKVMSILDCYF